MRTAEGCAQGGVHMSELPILPFKVDAFPVHTTDTIAEYLRSQHQPLGAQWCWPACAPRCVLMLAREWRASTCLRDV